MISTIAGGCPPCTTPAVPADAVSIAANPSGDLFLAFPNDHRVLEISNGVETTIAGQGGNAGFGGDGGPASGALLHEPLGVAVDSSGNVFIADSGNNRVREISGGTINTVAGSGTIGSGGDGGPPKNAQLMSPAAVGIGASGTFYIVDSGNQRIREVSAGVISSVVGNVVLGSDGDNIAATAATLSLSPSVAVDTSGNIYIAETGTHRIRKVSGGTITTVAGNGTQGYSGDGSTATNARLNGPLGLTVTASGDLYIADTGNSVVRKVSNGVITTVAGNGAQGYSGDNGPATGARLKFPAGVAVDTSGNLFIADTGNWAIRKVSGGTITTYVGNICCFPSGLNSPAGLTIDGTGNVYIADSANQRILQVSPNGTTSTVAGLGGNANGFGQRGYNGDNIPATTGELNFPVGVASDLSGNLYIADALNQRVRKVTDGVITTVAGNGTAGYSGDNGPPTSAQLTWPSGIAVDASGNLFIADLGNKRVRAVAAAPLSVSSAPTTLTIASPGGTANATLTITSAAGFSGSVTLSCTVSYTGQGTATDPPTCQLGASQVDISPTINGSTTLMVSTTPAQQARAPYRLRGAWQWPTGSFALLLAMLFVPAVRSRGQGKKLLFATVAGTLALLPSCSSGGRGNVGGTTTGNYKVTTMATSGSFATTASVPLVVQ
jgi:sugar lactone lactonase YvrE